MYVPEALCEHENYPGEASEIALPLSGGFHPMKMSVGQWVEFFGAVYG